PRCSRSGRQRRRPYHWTGSPSRPSGGRTAAGRSAAEIDRDAEVGDARLAEQPGRWRSQPAGALTRAGDRALNGPLDGTERALIEVRRAGTLLDLCPLQ